MLRRNFLGSLLGLLGAILAKPKWIAFTDVSAETVATAKQDAQQMIVFSDRHFKNEPVTVLPNTFFCRCLFEGCKIDGDGFHLLDCELLDSDLSEASNVKALRSYFERCSWNHFSIAANQCFFAECSGVNLSARWT